MNRKNKIFAGIFLAFLCASVCFAEGYGMKIDVDGARKRYQSKVSVSPMDSGVKIEEGKIILQAKNEDFIYTISGYFNGQIINKTKNTEIKLKNAFIENTDGLSAIYGEAKTKVSSVQDSVNYVVSSGKDQSKSGALHCKKNLVLGGSGSLYVVGEVYHAVKADDVKIKGSGTFYFKGTSKGSGINCQSFTVEKDKTFKAYFLNSKNGIKADSTINIASGSFSFQNNETALKTDLTEESPDLPHSIILAGGEFFSTGNGTFYETEKGAFKARPKIVEY
ncbi:MAG: carbohydrate-binding domain-containing protein [Treponemataceae bacterium]|nr:carbohydrate-binding domain-containing protein [Treponemataceae bacterium]